MLVCSYSFVKFSCLSGLKVEELKSAICGKQLVSQRTYCNRNFPNSVYIYIYIKAKGFGITVHLWNELCKFLVLSGYFWCGSGGFIGAPK